MGFTKHGINQAINRGIASGDILDALNYGANAVVVLNPFGEVITLWPR